MIDGGTPDRVQQGVSAAKELVPLAAQYPMAFAMVVICAMFAVAIWFIGRRLLEMTEVLSKLVTVLEVQATTIRESDLKGMRSDIAVLLDRKERAAPVPVAIPPAAAAQGGRG